MSVEFIGYVGHFNSSETMRRTTMALDLGYIETVAKAHEHVGFDRVLVAFNSTSAESILVGQQIAAVTERLGLMIAHRPGFTAPTLAARQFATLDHFSRGRTAVHIITGGNDTELAQDGDHLTKDERYARTAEYLDIVRQEWTASSPFDYAGKYYQVAAGFGDLKPVQPGGIPVLFRRRVRRGAARCRQACRCLRIVGRNTGAGAQPGRPRARRRGAVRPPAALQPVLAPGAGGYGKRRPGPRRTTSWPGRGALQASGGSGRSPNNARQAQQAPANEGSRRLLAAAAQGSRAGPAAVDRHRSADGGAGQLHRAGRHARPGGGSDDGLLRAGDYDDLPDPWLRPAGGRDPVWAGAAAPVRALVAARDAMATAAE